MKYFSFFPLIVGEFPTTWGTTTTDAKNPDHNVAGPSPNAGWASNWPSSSTTNNGSKAAPINPFTGMKYLENISYGTYTLQKSEVYA